MTRRRRESDEATQAAAAVQTGPLIYLGPSLPGGILSQHQIFKDGKISAHLSELVDKDPDIGLLIVPVNALNETKAKLKEIGTPEQAVYERLTKGV